MQKPPPQRQPEQFRFVLDTPAGRDEFGAHRRVAAALVRTIAFNPAVRMIGVTGPWGSGKSTVMRLFEARCKRLRGHTGHVFIFDAWRHHGEPVRRAFLEEFYAFCAAAQPGDADAAMQARLRERVDELTGRSSTTETREDPQVSRGGLAILASFAVAVYGLAQGHRLRRVPTIEGFLTLFPDWLPVTLPVLVPILTVMIVAASRLGALRKARAKVNRNAALILIATATALHAVKMQWTLAAVAAGATATGLCVATYALLHSRGKVQKSKDVTAADVNSTYDTILGLILSRLHQSKRTRVRGNPAPTAIEFTEAFWKTVKGSFAKEDSIAIIVDNLDRLPSSEAREAWAALRAFFAGSPIEVDPSVSRVVVIVPVAEEAVDILYGSDASQSFMEKTFDVVFHLPRPALTSWEDYLKHRMTEAFGRSYQDEWYILTARLVDARFHHTEEMLLPGGGSSKDQTEYLITPRTINALVNRILRLLDAVQTRRHPFCIDRVLLPEQGID